MVRSIPEDSPFKMRVPTRRDALSGEGLLWYDRAAWLRGKTLQIPPSQRTAFQHGLDEIWDAVERFERGEETALDGERLEQIFASFFRRWPEVVGAEPPAEIA